MEIEKEELENCIKNLNNCINILGDINMSCSNLRERTLYQKKLNKAYDIIYELKKHIEFLKKMEERKNGSR